MKRSKFDLSFPIQTTFNAGKLVPFLVQDTLPNDTFYISARSFIRAQPMTAPLLHDVDVFLQYWYCPERILWDNAEAFFLGSNELEGLASPTRPYITTPAEGFGIGSLADYIGVPTPLDANDATGKNVKFSAIPFRAYAKIWNDKYRDKNLQNEVSFSFNDGLDETTSRSLLSPNFKKDYFHNAEQVKQLGASVNVPITQASGDEAHYYHYEIVIDELWVVDNMLPAAGAKLGDPIERVYPRGILPTNGHFGMDRGGAFPTVTITQVKDWVKTHIDSMVVGQKIYIDQFASEKPTRHCVAMWLNVKQLHQGSNATAGIVESASNARIINAKPDSSTLVLQVAEGKIVYHSSSLQTSGSLSIENLSQATHMQRYQERMLKIENDYSKFLKQMYGFSIRSDIIDEPQYLGGSRAQIVFSEVVQTSEGTQGGVGSMYGHGVGRAKQRPIKFRCPEHGVILGLISVRPRFVYSQGIDRAWSRKSRFDFFLPDFTDIGLQEVMQKELMATSSNDSILFGYTERFEEYRRRFPKIAGMFKRELANWNMAQKFSSPPSLNGSFLSMSGGDAAFARPFAVPSEHQYLMYLFNRITAIRNVPKYASRTKI